MTDRPPQHQRGKIFMPRNPTDSDRKLFLDELIAKAKAHEARLAKEAKDNEQAQSDDSSTP